MRRPRGLIRRRPLPRRAVIALVLCGVVAVVALVATTGVVVWRIAYAATASPPGIGTSFLAPDISKAARALSEDDLTDDQRTATAAVAAQPSAYWLTPEQDPPGTVGVTLTGLFAQAREEDATLAVVVYGLPGRDCGNHSAGGLDEDDYGDWVAEIGAALETAADLEKVVVLEPDSLALALECDNLDDRVRQLRTAVDAIASPGTWIYLDGGHSGWHTPDDMAALVSAVDVGGAVRGFATNVSNYRSDHDEFAYAHDLSEALGGMHALIDTSRNGAASAGDEWCNPPDQRVGAPSGTYGDDVVDTNLWVKPPGESDGPCNGGPAAGVWWPDAAVELMAGTP